MNNIQMPEFRDRINRGLDDGCTKLTKKSLLAMTGGDLSLGFLLLKQWESRGLLRIEVNPFLANDDEICIHMLDYIDQKSPWPNFPSKD